MAKPYGAYGNVIVIRHPNGLETVYSHNVKNLVKSGDAVKAGKAIALTGRTGRATTEHLHFETRINGQHFNPGLIFDMDKRTLRKDYLQCTKKGKGIIVKALKSEKVPLSIKLFRLSFMNCPVLKNRNGIYQACEIRCVFGSIASKRRAAFRSSFRLY